MADTLYAWSPIRVGESTKNAENPGEVKTIKPGDKVSQSDLGLDDDQFKQLVESGAVRSMEYPNVPETYQSSPVDYLREQARKAAEGALGDALASEENMSAILAANAASTGTAALPENVEPGTGPSEDATPPKNDGGK